jgi:hypothetical protein
VNIGLGTWVLEGVLMEMDAIGDGFVDPKILLLMWVDSCWLVLSGKEVTGFPVLEKGNGLYNELDP